MLLSSIIQRLSDQIATSGLTPMRSPLGVQEASTPRADESFALFVSGINPIGNRGRGNAAGAIVEIEVDVTLIHLIKPTSGFSAEVRALDGFEVVCRAILDPSGLLADYMDTAIGPMTVTIEANTHYLTTFTVTFTGEQSYA